MNTTMCWNLALDTTCPQYIVDTKKEVILSFTCRNALYYIYIIYYILYLQTSTVKMFTFKSPFFVEFVKYKDN